MYLRARPIRELSRALQSRRSCSSQDKDMSRSRRRRLDLGREPLECRRVPRRVRLRAYLRPQLLRGREQSHAKRLDLDLRRLRPRLQAKQHHRWPPQQGRRDGHRQGGRRASQPSVRRSVTLSRSQRPRRGRRSSHRKRQRGEAERSAVSSVACVEAVLRRTWSPRKEKWSPPRRSATSPAKTRRQRRPRKSPQRRKVSSDA